MKFLSAVTFVSSMLNALFCQILSGIWRLNHCAAGIYKDDQNLELYAHSGPTFNVDMRNHRISGLD